jgi:hypothetical protein
LRDIWSGKDAQPGLKLSRDTGLLARPALEKWLYSLFLKITLPYIRLIINGSPVYSPLNLSSFLRLVAHLGDIGYPAHWLSSVLSVLCTGIITTSARPPQRLVTSPADIDAVLPPCQMTTAPWVAQFTTLLSIWSKLLPFGLIMVLGTLVALSEIAEFTVSFPLVTEDTQLRVPQFVSFFWQARKMKVLSGQQLYEVSREDRKNALKSDAIHVMTAMEFDDETRTAMFWCRVDAIEGMKK